MKMTLVVLNIVDAASELHFAISNLIVRRWDRWKNNDKYLRQIGEFQTMSVELSDVKEQLCVASPTEGYDPDERSKHGVPRQQDPTQQQPPTESSPKNNMCHHSPHRIH